MSFMSDLLRWFGLSTEARVRVSAPKIQVVISGDPKRVRWMLDAVKRELEHNPRYRSFPKLAESSPNGEFVRPSELDERDSPYALPEAVVVPVPERESQRTKVVFDQSLSHAPGAAAVPPAKPATQPPAGTKGLDPPPESPNSLPMNPEVQGSFSTPVRGRSEADRRFGLGEWSEESFKASEEETPSDFAPPFGSEETVNDERLPPGAALPRISGSLIPDVRPTEEVKALGVQHGDGPRTPGASGPDDA